MLLLSAWTCRLHITMGMPLLHCSGGHLLFVFLCVLVHCHTHISFLPCGPKGSSSTSGASSSPCPFCTYGFLKTAHALVNVLLLLLLLPDLLHLPAQMASRGPWQLSMSL